MLKIGHRGASAYLPENTLSSFKRAMSLGADGIELDVHRCQSGELVVIHDDTIDRTTNGKGPVSEMTLTALRELTVTGDEKILTLEEVLEALGREAYYFIEIKHADAALDAAEIIKAFIAKGWPAEKLILISFQHQALAQAKEAVPVLTIGASFDQVTEHSASQAKDLGATFMLPNHRCFTLFHVKQAHKAGLKVIPWTVNDSNDIARLQAMNVDGIISDYPDRLTT